MRTIKIILSAFVAFTALTVLALEYVVPAVIEHEVRSRLPATARFEVGNVALDRVELLDVSLARGIDLGDVTIHAGPWQLWRGARPDVVLQGPRIETMPTMTLGSTGGAKAPIGRVTIVDGHVDQLAVSGTIDLGGEVDLVAKSPVVHAGDTVVRDVAATVRGPLAALRACATGRVDRVQGRVQVDACMKLDATKRERADLSWSAHAGGWSANGRAQLVREDESIAIASGSVDAVVERHVVRGVTVERATLHADVAGELSKFSVRGMLRAGELAADNVSVREATLPFALTGSVTKGLRLRSDHELVMTATSATVKAAGRSLRIAAPSLTARGAVGPFSAVDNTPLQLVAHVRGLPVEHVVAAASKNRIHGTGVLDGKLVFDEAFSLVGGKLAARSPGRLRVAALEQTGDLGTAVHRRIAAALSDFDYARLELAVADDPDLVLTLRGRGHRVPQELALDINVRSR